MKKKQRVSVSLSSVVGFAGLALTVVGLVLTMYSIGIENQIRTLSWSDMQSAAKYIAKKTRREFMPDYMITPGQKGGIFAYLISEYYPHEMPIVTGYMISRHEESPSISDDNFLIENHKWYVVLPKEILQWTDRKVLIVDDCVMGGVFMGKLKQILFDSGYSPDNVRTCAIVTSQFAVNQERAPDYYWKEAVSDFFFPWGRAN